jgi:chemotaxis-related protein WspB
MLFLLFRVGENIYALDSSHIVEVIPMVNLRKVYGAPEHMSGLFNYRGAIIPVIDFSYLIRGSYSRLHLSTRIIILHRLHQQDGHHYLGLIAEQVTETLNKTNSELLDLNLNISNTSYLSQMMIDEQKMIQCIEVEQLLDNSQQLFLLAGAS